MNVSKLQQPLAITMWDFSWLERRWPGAGYEDWDRALDELQERGYNAVRIDAFPHLISAGPKAVWRIKPVWPFHDWGACGSVDVQVQPHLNQFIGKCAERNILVALSTWNREDETQRRMLIGTPAIHAEMWRKTLATIEEAGLLDHILYVDLCNEWNGWAPFFRQGPDGKLNDWRTPASRAWMREAIERLRTAYPQLSYCFSFSEHLFEPGTEGDLSFMDLLEPHVWMSKDTTFYSQIGFEWNSFSLDEYKPVIEFAERLYREDPAHWQNELTRLIGLLGRFSEKTNLPLATTECWAIVNYRDWPRLDWGWVKELCAFGVEQAIKTRRWFAMATSNFCGPQFAGMWRDVEWHQRLTHKIKAGGLQ
jgi:hypothetical protein